jgi:F0F1-type ATP synthase membrane subunit b/b'
MKFKTLKAIKKLVIGAILAGSPIVYAEEAGHGHGPPAPEGTVEVHGHGDPTKHFNFAGNWFSYGSKDVYGGKLGDGKMLDHDGRVLVHRKETPVLENGKPVIGPDGKPLVNTTFEPLEEEVMSPPFVFMLLNFGILLFILGKFGGPVARKSAEERHDQIKTALDEAAKLRDDAEKKLAEYETRIKDVDAEVKKLVDGIRADAEADKARILATAAKQAEQMKKDAETRIAAEIEFARAALQREVAVAASGATEKLLREKVTGDDQTKLVTTFITNVSSHKEAR